MCDADSYEFEDVCVPHSCGDGIKSGIEQCDDSNNVDNDGCTNCLVDELYDCSSGSCVCKEGYESLNNQCVLKCEENKFWNQEGVCQSCSEIY